MNDLAEGSLTGEQEQQLPTNDNSRAIEGSWEDPLPVPKQAAAPVQQSTALPTWDDAVKQKLPSWDEALKPSAVGLAKNALNSQEYDAHGNYTESPAVQQFMKGTSLGRVMSAFNEGFGEQTQGYQNLGIEPGSDTEKFLTKAGLMQDITKNDNSIVKAVTGGAMVAAASSLDAAMRTFGGVISGAGAAAKQVGGPLAGVGEILQAVPEGFGAETAGATEHAFTAKDFHEAKSAGVMDGEAVYMGLKEPTPEQREAQHASAEQVPQEPEIPAFDIHTEVRKVAPETFDQYDRIRNQQDTLREQLSTLSDEKGAKSDAVEKTPEQIQDERETIQTHIEALTSKKKLKDADQDKLSDLQNQLKELDNQSELKSGSDTPEMAAARQKIQELDYKLRDLAPQVSEAYRKAEINNPVQELSPQTAQEQPTIVPQGATGGTIGEAPNTLRTDEEPGQKPSLEREGQVINIREDVAKKLVGAGRPAEEANAAAQLVEAHYQARSERFGGKLGTAEEMYARDSATIKAGRGVAREKELAQADGFADADTVKYRRDLDALDKGTLQHRAVLRIGKTPDIISKIGGNDGQLVISPTVIRKIESGKHSLSRTITARLKTLLSDPIAVFDSGTEKGDIVAAISVKDDNGHQVIVPIRISRDGRQNIVTSVYGKEDASWFAQQTKKGRLRYVNTGKVSEIPTLAEAIGENRSSNLPGFSEPNVPGEVNQEPLSSAPFGLPRPNDLGRTEHGPKDTILTEADFVNKNGQLIDKTKDLNQTTRGKYNPETNAITLMKSANASTFIHETGHQWLEELMEDAQRPEAPQDLTKDAQTVRDWLGAKDGEDITTRQHEKFARGFERYMMEGTAPSKGLAAVFAKFKQWLTQIYQTVERLKSPITDDIRDVFDRLLTKNPEKTVVAPEQEIGKQFADIHEADAKTTPPEHAAHVRDNIEQEQDQLAKTHNPEAFDALRSADKTGAESAQTSGPQPVGPEPATGESGISAQPTEKQPSSSGSGAESSAARTEPRPTDTGNTGRGKQAGENGTSPFGSKQPDLIDKAGNIRLDNLNTPEDINKVLRATAEGNDNFMGARRGVIPAAQQLELADALGMQPSDINFRKVGEAWNAEQILAARKMLIQSATNVRDLMVKAADGTDQDVLAYAEAKQRHLMIQEHVAGITAEAGRALGAFRKLEGAQEANALGDFLKQATGKDLFQLKQEAAFGSKLETPEQVSMFMNATKKASFRDMVLEYYINCLISGPITHARYSVGNALNAIWTPLVEIPAAAAIGKIREAVTGQDVPNRVYLGEAGAQLAAIFKGSREGLTAGATAFKTGVSPLLPGEHISDNFANVKMNAIPGKLGQVINIPGKSVSAIHSFFKSVRYEQNIHGQAYRTAMNEGLDDEAFNGRVAYLIQNPTEDMMKEATNNSLRELYMSPTEYNSFMGSLNRAVNSNLAAKIIVPFMKIGSQITRNAFIERTPLGLLSKDVRDNIGSNSAGSDMQLARIGTGVALIGATSLMTMEGLATGDGPTDPNQRRVWLLNHKPNSIQIGDISIPYQGLGHLGMLMRFSANMTDTAKAWDMSDGEKLAKSFFSLLEGVNKSVLDENFMRGVKDLLDAAYHPEEYGTNYVRQFATNWLPFSVGLSQVARQIDPDYREAHTIFEAARSKIPFASEGLEPKRDVFGEPIPTGGSVQNYENDPVAQRMDALNMGVGKLNKKILGVPLNEQQYDDFSRIAGRMAKMRLNALVANPGFQNLPDHVQIDTIHKLITDSRKTASSIVMMQNPSIIQQAKDNKLNALHSQK